MPLDWLNTPLDADIGELLARKKRAKTIEALRQRLQGRLAPPVTVRLQLADLLMQAGRADEAIPVLLGLADEFAADGFVAKAVAILKRIEKAQPGRADVSERLEKLVHQQKRVIEVAPRPRSAMPDFGMEEIGEGEPDLSAAFTLPDPMPAVTPDLAAGGGSAASADESAAGADESAATADQSGGAIEALVAPETTTSAEAAPIAPPEPEFDLAAEPEPVTLPDASGQSEGAESPSMSATAETTATLDAASPEPIVEPEAGPPPVSPPPDAEIAVEPDSADIAPDAAPPRESGPDAAPLEAAPTLDPAAGVDLASESAEMPADDGAAPGTPGVGRRIRRALWRFLASLPSPEEAGQTDGAPPAETPSPAAEPPALEPAAAQQPPEVTPSEPMPPSEPIGAAATPEPPAPAPAVTADLAAPVPEPVPEAVASEATPSPTEAAALPDVYVEFAHLDPPADAEDAMSDEAFRDQLLDLVSDVLHRPAASEPAPEELAMDRARMLDLARRLVASRLFRDLSDEELLAIVRGFRLRTFEPGDIVVTEGEPGGSLFTLTTGMVKVFVRNPDGRNFEVATLAEGDFFGEISSLSGHPRTATVVAATACELLELDRPTLDSVARTHARVRDVVESSYIERASSAEVAAVRAVALPEAGTRRKASEVLEAHFGESRWEPRMRLRLADVLLKAGKDKDAVSILVGLADELAREGYADKAVAILKKIEQVQRRNVEVVNLAPLLRPQAGEPARKGAAVAPPAAAPGRALRPRPVTDDHLHGWLVDLVRDTVAAPEPSRAPAVDSAVARAYGPGLLANPLFEGFSEEELVAFIRGLRLLAFEPGDIIVTEGEPGQSVFILTTGSVKVFVRGPQHKDVRLAVLGEGSFFGEISTLSGRPRTATITAAGACEILELDRPALDAISARHPRVRSVLESFSEVRSRDAEAARARGAGA